MRCAEMKTWMAGSCGAQNELRKVNYQEDSFYLKLNKLRIV